MSRLLLLLPLLLTACGHVGKPQVIYLARHGQTEWNRTARFQGDPDLDSVGYINRFSLWNLLKDRPLHSIYTSERLRTRRTAALLSKQHDLQIQTRAALNEIDPGVLEGICFSQLDPTRSSPADRACVVEDRGSNPEIPLREARRLFKEAWRDRVNGKLPLGQSFQDIVEQTAAFVDELSRGLEGREVLVVGHGVVNRALLHHLMGWPAESVARLRQENDQVYRIEGAESGAPSLFLYSPSTGWRRCQSTAPTRGQKQLDCHPKPARPSPAPAPMTPTPPPAEEPEQQPPAATQPAV